MSCVNPNSSTLKTFNAVTKFAFNLVLRLRDDRKLCHKMRSYRVASTPNMCVRARDMPACMFQSPTRGPLTGSQSHLPAPDRFSFSLNSGFVWLSQVEVIGCLPKAEQEHRV